MAVTHGRVSTYAAGCRCPECRAARAAYMRAYRAAHPEFEERNRAKTRENWRRKRAHSLGANYDELYQNQSGRCAICQVQPARLMIDHDHATGTVRGLLCNDCNMMLGWARDSIQRLSSAIEYLQ